MSKTSTHINSRINPTTLRLFLSIFVLLLHLATSAAAPVPINTPPQAHSRPVSRSSSRGNNSASGSQRASSPLPDYSAAAEEGMVLPLYTAAHPRFVLTNAHRHVGLDSEDERIAQLMGRGQPPSSATFVHFETSSDPKVNAENALKHVEHYNNLLNEEKPVEELYKDAHRRCASMMRFFLQVSGKAGDGEGSAPGVRVRRVEKRRVDQARELLNNHRRYFARLFHKRKVLLENRHLAFKDAVALYPTVKGSLGLVDRGKWKLKKREWGRWEADYEKEMHTLNRYEEDFGKPFHE